MTLRPYRFPPLAQLTARAALPPQDLQAALAGGYQEGQQRGYREGHASGLRRGHDEGLAAAHAEGMRNGAQQALREVRERFAGVAEPVDALLGALHRSQDEYAAAQRKELVDLVARVARQVIRCELALQPVQLLALVDETLAAMPAPHKGVEIHLNGDDLARILEVDPVRATRWALIADPQLEPGECRVKTERREADAGCRQRLAACMEQVSAQLLDPQAAPAAPVVLAPVEAPIEASVEQLARAIAQAEAADAKGAAAAATDVATPSPQPRPSARRKRADSKEPA